VVAQKLSALRPLVNFAERERETETEAEAETETETEARIISDSSSCRAFSQRQGVGRLKHINVKYLWLQEKIKECALQMDGVPTVLNIADLGTKRLAKVQRDFLMFLIGLVEYDRSGRRCFQLLPAEESSWKQDEISGTGDAEIPHGWCGGPAYQDLQTHGQGGDYHGIAAFGIWRALGGDQV